MENVILLGAPRRRAAARSCIQILYGADGSGCDPYRRPCSHSVPSRGVKRSRHRTCGGPGDLRPAPSRRDASAISGSARGAGRGRGALGCTPGRFAFRRRLRRRRRLRLYRTISTGPPACRKGVIPSHASQVKHASTIGTWKSATGSGRGRSRALPPACAGGAVRGKPVSLVRPSTWSNPIPSKPRAMQWSSRAHSPAVEGMAWHHGGPAVAATSTRHRARGRSTKRMSSPSSGANTSPAVSAAEVSGRPAATAQASILPKARVRNPFPVHPPSSGADPIASACHPRGRYRRFGPRVLVSFAALAICKWEWPSGRACDGRSAERRSGSRAAARQPFSSSRSAGYRLDPSPGGAGGPRRSCP